MINIARVAFSGSGYLAPIHAGAICAFMDAGVFICEVAGTSGGSIAASLVASGMTYAEIKATALATLPEGIVAYNPIDLFEESLNSGSILHTWLKRLFKERTIRTSVVPITIMATDINNSKSYRFNSQETPNVLLADAVRASASVPIIYKPIVINGKKLIDGGASCNIPVNQLVQDRVPRFGIEVIDGDPSGTTDTLVGLILQFIKTLMLSNEDNLIAWGEHTGATIIPVDATPYSFLNAELTLEQKTDLFQRGYTAVAAALHKN